MTILNIPAFTIRPDWSDQVLETLEWRTSVLQALRQGPDGPSATAAEQRRMLRIAPRRTLELNLVLFKEERTYFDLLIHAAGASDFYVPLFHHVDVLQAGVDASSTFIPISRPYSELTPLTGAGESLAGGPCILIGEDWRTYEVFEAGYVYSETGSIYGANGLYILTEGGLAGTWPKGSRLFPLMQAKLSQQPQFKEVTSAARTATVQFISSGIPQDWTSTGQEGFDTYQGFPVMVREPNRIDDLDGSFARNINTTDNETGLWVYTDVSGRGFGAQTHTWYCVGRKEHAAVRDMLYLLKGQLTGFWLPTFSEDIFLAQDATPDQSQITINYIGYSDLGFPVEGRDTIVIFMSNGDRVYCRITSGTVDGATEILSLQEPLGVYLTDTLVRKISFMQYSRFAQDAMEIAHVTDNQGVGTISANVTAISYDRDAPDWNPAGPVYPDPLAGGCGFIPAIFMTSLGPDTCGPGGEVFGFNFTEIDTPEPADHIAYLNQTFGSNGDWTIRWLLERSDFTVLYGNAVNVAVLSNNRPPDRAGIPYSIDYDVGFFQDTNAIADNHLTTTVKPNLGNQQGQQGCHAVANWNTPGHTLAVQIAVAKAGIGVGATNIDYTFVVVLTAAGVNYSFSFAEADDMPVEGTQFNFHVSMRSDGAGKVRYIVTSAYHGTAIDQTYAAPEADGLFNFTLLHSILYGGRASNADLAVLENVVNITGLSVEA